MIAETGSDLMLRFFTDQKQEDKVVSALAEVEARSAISRIARAGLISELEREAALDTLAVELGLLLVQPIDHFAIEAAGVMIGRYSLRALDAVQLGTAVVARNAFASSAMRFIASDKALLQAARAEGFEVWNPEA